jgi:hypothetical protein
MEIQNYEDYWKLTNAFTDYNGDGFLITLAICIKFIDEHNHEEYSPDKYTNLQLEIKKSINIDLISIRKAINQLVKMGFISSYLVSYNTNALEYLSAKTNTKRNLLLSKIIYSSSSFNRSIKNESNLHQMNFLIKTLIENGKLSKSEIIALMLVDIATIAKGYLNSKELIFYELEAIKIGFISRKYNQAGYLFNLLNKLDDITFVDDHLYFIDDAQRIFGDEIKEERKGRDPYLHRLYKKQLQEESIYYYKDTKCMVEKLAYPVLIASHIKPFINCDDNEAYDVNNGILLSRNIDSLFDLGYITFSNTGQIISSSQLATDVKIYIEKYSLDHILINDARINYLEYHRTTVFEKRYKSN